MDTTLSLEKPCLYPGEVVKCTVQVACNDASTGSGRLDVAVECYGSERIDPGWVGLLYRPEVPAIKDGRRLSRHIFHSGNLKILAGAIECTPFTKTFNVRFRLPSRIPPSYRGNAVGFQYHLHAKSIFKPTGSSSEAPLTSEAHTPFHVWPLGERPMLERRGSLPTPTSTSSSAHGGGGSESTAAPGEEEPDTIEYRVGVTDVKCRWEEVQTPNPSSLHSYPSGPIPQPPTPSASLMRLNTTGSTLGGELLQQGGDEDDGEADVVAMVLRQLTPLQLAHMAPRTYNLKAGDQPLVRITIQTPVDSLLQPGGTVGVLMDFRQAHGHVADRRVQPCCLQVVALLESREMVHAPYTYTKGQDSASMRKLYSEQQDITAHLVTSQFIFSIPPHAPVSFKTPLVSHRWVLRFELTIQHGLGAGKGGRYGGQQQLTWNLPLLVFPPPQLLMS